jgi:DNA modification methylase
MQISQEQYNKLPERLQKHFNHGNFHCTVKSVPLMEYLIKMITPKGGIVLDPFMGSGSTGIACKKNGFDFIGIEKEEPYYVIACARIKSAKVNLAELIKKI